MRAFPALVARLSLAAVLVILMAADLDPLWDLACEWAIGPDGRPVAWPRRSARAAYELWLARLPSRPLRIKG